MLDADVIEYVESTVAIEDIYSKLDEDGTIPGHDYFLMASDKMEREAAEAAVALANATGGVVQLHYNGMSVTVFTGVSPGKIEDMITRR